MPQPEKDKEYNFTLAASKAFFNVVRNVKVFSVDSLNSYEESLYGSFKEQLDDSVYTRSVAFGDTVAGAILARAKNDGYFQSRGKPNILEAMSRANGDLLLPIISMEWNGAGTQ